MKRISFTWDAGKNSTNITKHGVSFEEAQSVFYDDNARVMFDPVHSEDEDRFIILGLSERLHILVVCHCYKENEGMIRIISARKATKNEKKQYGECIK
ncbi:MAG TPA: BrnT family toxin [Spirochaetota bacterium]|nr:BrnT family toxin [Spirochaetota bacterium]HQP49084.1 BrnT family toxin [Spirochaetota bacterium]